MACMAVELARKKARLEDGAGSSSNVVSFNQQNFEQLQQDCLQNGSLFCDPTFPASWDSLGYNELGRNSSKAIGVEWKRPTELCSDPQFIVDGAKRTDICQGELGDCWLLAAIASLTLDHQILNRVVPPGQSFTSQYAGIFHFQLWQFGEWVDVVVDDRLPSRDGRLMFVHSEEGAEFWSALLEKAYAKLNGSYESLNGGSSIEGFEDFTGGIAESYDLQEAPPFLFNIMRKALRLGSLLGCSINISNSRETEAITPQKLVKGHAYSITAVEQVHHLGSPVELVRIRNPWGQVEWSGAWSDNSPEWTGVQPEERSRLDRPADDGEFWMSYRDFLQQFSHLDICNLTPDTLSSDHLHRWSYSEFEGVWRVGSTAGGCRNYSATFCSNPQFLIRLQNVDDDPHDGEDGCTVLIGLIQKDGRRERRFGRELNTIGFSVYQVPDQTELQQEVRLMSSSGQHRGRSNVRLGPDVLLRSAPAVRSRTFINLREVCDRFKLPPGDFVIVPSTFEPHRRGSFILRVFTEKHAHSRSEPEPEHAHSRSEPEPQPEPEYAHSRSESDPEPEHAHSRSEPEPQPEPEHTHSRSEPQPEPQPEHTHSRSEPDPEPEHAHSSPVEEDVDADIQERDIRQDDVDPHFKHLFAQISGKVTTLFISSSSPPHLQVPRRPSVLLFPQDSQISAFELQKILDKVVKQRSDVRTNGFSLQTCRNISLLDADGSSTVGLLEFHTLWNKIQRYLGIFKNHDSDDSGSMSSHEMRAALAEAGFQVNSAVIQEIVGRYADSSFSIDFDCFIGCLIRLEMLFKMFWTLDKQNQGRIQLDLQQWLCLAIN
ncbi:calpain-2 catalytic subunit-like isoform X3 [Amphiprion ocellaris]|uniref:calpain-2 catalytic subunit-like isoform X3 n=1 Tax=Amphiprion ocellaris TaxID=80972 RepID=UPI002410BA64|nr:calpain-2 catalytic subunit-like isoform X3 [Amphiprion ocellaris]